ncbi:MAG: WG repeat-containing protein [Clostridiales bacterium]|nr:WG repeat-containing protein [Clostridiales bacterium]
MKRFAIALLCLSLCLPVAGLGEEYLVTDGSVGTAVANRTIDVTLDNWEMQAALDDLNAGSLLDALNAFVKFGSMNGADRYAAYTQARLLMLRDEPDAAAALFSTLSGFLDSDYRLALANASSLHRFAQQERFGYVDRSGQWVIAPHFDWAERVFRPESALPHDPDQAQYAPEELYMVAAVFSGQTEIDDTDTQPEAGLYGLVRNDGTMVAPIAYTEVLWAVDGVAAVTDGYGAYLYDIARAERIGDAFQEIGTYENGYVTVRRNGLWGYLNPGTGAFVGAGCVWESALPFSEGLAGVSQDGLYGYINEAGTVVIDLQFTGAANFGQGLAGVRIQKRWGFINRKGEVALKQTYASVGTFRYGLCVVEKNGLWGLINRAGEVVLRIKYSEITPFDAIYHRAWFRQNKLWGLISTTGTVVLTPTWSARDDFNANTLCRVGYRNRYGFIDASGKTRIANAYVKASSFRADYAAVQETTGEVRYVDKTLRGFTVATNVPVECRCGFIEGRVITQMERAVTDDTGVSYMVLDPQIVYKLYDSEGHEIAVSPYAPPATAAPEPTATPAATPLSTPQNTPETTASPEASAEPAAMPQADG